MDTHAREAKNLTVVQFTGWCMSLSGLKLGPKAVRIPREPLVFSLHWNPKETGYTIIKGMLQQQDS